MNKVKKERLDVLLVERGFFETRENAKRHIMAGIILVNDVPVDKPGTKIPSDVRLRIKGHVMPYVGRGGYKLEKAIKEFHLDLKNLVMADIGASTGGFTDCALQNGIAKVYAIDVGTNQLDWKLRTNPHVINLEKTNIKQVVFDIRSESNPCSLCARLRSGAINSAAKENGCNKVALGHHNEDVIETFFLSLFYEGRINCFSPVTHLDRKDIYLIRPLIYTPESIIRGAAKRLNMPVCKNPCPADGYTKRQEMKEFVNEKDRLDHHFKDRIFNAIKTSGMEGWILPDKKQR